MSDDKKLLVDGEHLKTRRKRIKMSIQELSLETGLSTSFIRQIEKGGVEAEASALSKLAATLGVKPEEFMGGE